MSRPKSLLCSVLAWSLIKIALSHLSVCGNHCDQRPKIGSPRSQFLEDFGDFISNLVTRSDGILMIGDFNIHRNRPSILISKFFFALLCTFGFPRFVHEHTHYLSQKSVFKHAPSAAAAS